jgi:hypothetical protein
MALRTIGWSNIGSSITRTSGASPTGWFHVMGARRSDEPPFAQPESLSVPTKRGLVTDVTIGTGRKVAEEPNVGAALGLVDWKLRFGPQYLSRRDRAAIPELQELWSRFLTVPIKVRRKS